MTPPSTASSLPAPTSPSSAAEPAGASDGGGSSSSPPPRRRSEEPSLPRPARFAWVAGLVALVWLGGVAAWRSQRLERYADERVESLRDEAGALTSLFQEAFFFAYGERFLPGVRERLAGSGGIDELESVALFSSREGRLLFDSRQPDRREGGLALADPSLEREIRAWLTGPDSARLLPRAWKRGFGVELAVPSGESVWLFDLQARGVRNRTWALAGGGLAGIAVAVALAGAFARRRARRAHPRRGADTPGATDPGGAEPALPPVPVPSPGVPAGAAVGRRWRFWGLNAKFLVTILLVNLITSAIVFFTLSALMTREQTDRIEKESLLFSQFSSPQVISEFRTSAYYYYSDRFLPAIRWIIASNENLVAIRVISRRERQVLFDSQTAANGPVIAAPGDAGQQVELPGGVETELRLKQLASRPVERDGRSLLVVYSSPRSDDGESLYVVEYLFAFETLRRSLQAIRAQLLLDLAPSLILGFLIGLAFVRLLIRPIRRLVGALQLVAGGDYEATVPETRSDELGELISAFNAMTGELRKKQELRKYLSDSTYQRIMEAPDAPGGARLGGARVRATILFSDIRDFVRHCESMEAEEVTAMLNDYFAEMVEVVHKHGGEVDKFIGDALLAVFYADEEVRTIRPVGEARPSEPATAFQAIACALEMRERLAGINVKRATQAKPPLEIGVGISHGEVISGPIGSRDRMDFTVIGDVVNLAARIEKLSKQGKHTRIVFAPEVEALTRGLLDHATLGTQTIQGKDEEIPVYELVGLRDLRGLVEDVLGEDGARRCRALEVLGQSQNPDAIPAVVQAVAHPDEETRIQAILALGRLCPPDDVRGMDPLFALLRAEASDRVVSAAVAALGRVCSTERILEIARFLSSPNERIVANTVEALGQVRSPRCQDLVLPKLSSRNNRIKANAAMALFAAGRVEVISTLKPMLMHSDPLMRSSAAFALGELTRIADQERLFNEWRKRAPGLKLFLAELQESVPMLVSLLRDPEPIVRKQAVIALGKIRDKSTVLPLLDLVEDRSPAARELLEEVAQALRGIGSHKLVREVVSRLR